MKDMYGVHISKFNLPQRIQQLRDIKRNQSTNKQKSDIWNGVWYYLPLGSRS